jgi:hypothetical protein
MTRALLVGNGLVLLLVISLTSLGAREGDPDPDDPAALTAAERKLVVDLAEQALKAKDLLSGKVYLTRIEVFHDNKDGRSPRKAIVTHYRYEGDLALLTHIDLGRKKVLYVESLRHFPTPLAPEEREQAIKLARAHPEVQKLLKQSGSVQLEPLPIDYGMEDDPAHEHRVVDVLFRQDGYYLRAPNVHVDLTTERVYSVAPRMPMPK